MKTLVRIVLAVIAYVAGCMITGIVAPLLHIPPLHGLPGVDPNKMFLALVASTPLLILGISPLAAGIGGPWCKRFMSLSALLYVTLGLNTMIEAKIFSTVVEGSAFLASLYSLLPAMLVAAMISLGNGSRVTESPLVRTNRGGWSWRLLVAWLSFPIIYWTFGMCVGPFVVSYYNNSVIGLRIPAPSIIVGTQLLRSVLFLAASLPAVLLWRKSRREFIVAMGLAHAFAVGIFQLASAIFMPPTLRILHSIEITADSFAYAAVLGWLFIAKAAVTPETTDSLKSEEVLAPVSAGHQH